jgi:hypothetical protein
LNSDKAQTDFQSDIVNTSSQEDGNERKSVADSLRRQIEQLKQGHRSPRSLNEFIDQKMAEEKNESEHGLDRAPDHRTEH